MKRKIRKIGNSIMIAIPPSMIETLELEIGNKTEIKTVNKQIIITKIKGDEK
jgi:antitoxin component of MazEF toxin-antitoxin module